MAHSYRDLYITTRDIPRASIFNLPFGVIVRCNRAAGWGVWNIQGDSQELIGAEFDPRVGLILDVAGHVIVDSLTNPRKLADESAKLLGIAFLVDGKFVSAERVQVVTNT